MWNTLGLLVFPLLTSCKVINVVGWRWKEVTSLCSWGTSKWSSGARVTCVNTTWIWRLCAVSRGEENIRRVLAVNSLDNELLCRFSWTSHSWSFSWSIVILYDFCQQFPLLFHHRDAPLISDGLCIFILTARLDLISYWEFSEQREQLVSDSVCRDPVRDVILSDNGLKTWCAKTFTL